MELILSLGLVLLMALAFFARIGRKARRRSTFPKKTELPNVGSQPRSFDPETAQPSPPNQILHGYARIIDGDTISIKNTQIRLFGIDAPEINHPYGQKAKWALVSICKGRPVKAEITETDSHCRTVARCTLEDGRDLSAEMVKAGLAIDWPKFSGGKYRSLEISGVRKKLWLADARQKGRMHVWENFEANRRSTPQT